MADPSPSLEALDSSLDTLEDLLAPLLSTPLDDTLADLTPAQQAKLQAFMGYLVHDLSWVYLRTRGVDPATHPVTQELDRVKASFAKLKSSLNPQAPAAAKPAGPSSHLDKDAATRFITHALASASAHNAKASRIPLDHTHVNESNGPVVLPEIRVVKKGVHKRFDDDDEEEEGSDEDKDLEVFDGEEGKGKGKKMKKPKLDAYSEYADPTAPPLPPSKKQAKKEKRKAKALARADATTTGSTS